jgi:hypothetical protein
MVIRDNGLWETDAGEVYEIIKSDKADVERGLEDGSELMCWLNFSLLPQALKADMESSVLEVSL